MPIVIEAGSGLSIPNAGPGNRQRFADVFRDGWLSIPAADRQVIVAWWGQGIVGQAASPMIYLVANHQLPAECQSFGHSIYFNASVADLMPDNILASLIGHELAHVRHYAQPGSHANTPGATHQQRESEADATAIGWGFSTDNLRDWANANAVAIVAATGNTNIGW